MNHISLLRRRLDSYAAHWGSAVHDLESYGAGRSGRRSSPGGDRYWTLLPRVIWNAWAPVRVKRESGFLNDVLWGQYCVFLFVRIHDDLLDGQARHAHLIFLADDLVLESQRAFAAQVNSAEFRGLFERHLRATLRAIVKVDVLQARPGGMTRARLSLHARVSSIFNLGSAAACLACRRPGMIRRFENACANLAIAGQLLDDLTDVEEDLARGRYNFVANVLGGGRRLDSTTTSGQSRIAHGVLRKDGVDKVLALVRLYATRAAEALAPTRIPEVQISLETYLTEIERMRRAVYRARVAHVFSSVMPV